MILIVKSCISKYASLMNANRLKINQFIIDIRYCIKPLFGRKEVKQSKQYKYVKP